ncbi:MAG: hypothetical protein EZS28_001609 [Streblomastix strix]|uniref:Uncharacterized protein n=1 Tax=Streblomastix strix TaxID=222440 RepID=A0A5J4X6N8_9EUKA|nr:MAG: hypothetical protein EZS28_001609 [Streblomastix strix]
MQRAPGLFTLPVIDLAVTFPVGMFAGKRSCLRSFYERAICPPESLMSSRVTTARKCWFQRTQDLIQPEYED